MNAKSVRTSIAGLTAIVALTAVCGTAAGQTRAPDRPVAQPASEGQRSVTASPHRVNLTKLQRRINVEFKEQRLEDVIKFIQEFTTADIEPEWSEDGRPGLDKDKTITLNSINLPALDLLERVLVRAQADAFQENGWQMTSYGTVQIGPKEVLNRDKRIVIYDINDLLMVIPRYTEVPEIDLNSVLQQGQGGSGQSPFQGTGGGGPGHDPVPPREDRIRQLIDLIVQIVEPQQWVDNGGEGGTIRAYGNTLIVNAPDYMHRQINGYPFWPTATTRVVEGRRYVSLTTDQGISKVDGFARERVTGTTGGQGGGGGGGGTGTGGGGRAPGGGGG
ncbi:MAG: hypothetical protein KF768_06745 [Phycisphaeraceae bacterium]|nr:hypothetical protein [Phycisphaeraceae bacterium]